MCLNLSMSATSNMHYDHLWINANLATMVTGNGPFGLLEDAAIAVCDGKIIWLGPMNQLPSKARQNSTTVLDCEGQLVTPGLIDCHTHLIYGGDRAHEFEMRLNGASYEDIARAGGGIAGTVEATRAASEEELFLAAGKRLVNFLAEGVTTVEVKSGYGLNLDDELKMLRVARRLGKELPLDVVTTFLGAHSLPPEFQNRGDDYIDFVCNSVLPAVAEAELATSVDAFCEGIAFSCDQVAKVFEAAQQHDLAIKLHAEQLSNLGGAAMAAKHGALSVDHLEYLEEGDVTALAENSTVAVLLPGAYYFLRETQLPPIQALRDGGVDIAIASDSNPGSSPVQSLLLMLNMACTLFRLSPEEALAGVTRNAATALGLQETVGTLEVGKVANLVLWRTQQAAALSYQIGGNLCQQVMYRGQIR